MPKALLSADDPTRSGWQWEKMKAQLAEEYHNPAKWEANCKGDCCCCSLHTSYALDATDLITQQPKLCHMWLVFASLAQTTVHSC